MRFERQRKNRTGFHGGVRKNPFLLGENTEKGIDSVSHGTDACGIAYDTGLSRAFSRQDN